MGGDPRERGVATAANSGQLPELLGGDIPFAQDLQRVLSYAPHEADRMNHNYVGSEHFLLALLHDTKAAQALDRLGFSLQSARIGVEFIIGRGKNLSAHPTDLSPRAKVILKTATEEARKKGLKQVGLNEFVSALFSSEGIYSGVLESLRINPSDVAKEITRGEICRHDREFFWELSHRLQTISYSSRDAIPTSRPRDIDKRTEALLKKVLQGDGIVRFHLSEDKLNNSQGMLISGPFGQVYSIIFNEGLTAREKNRLMLHFIGVIVTGNLGDSGLHEDINGGDKSQDRADSDANAWVDKFKDELLSGKHGKTVFALGVQRALSPKALTEAEKLGMAFSPVGPTHIRAGNETSNK